MDVTEAIEAAKSYVRQVYSGESISGMRPEETELDRGHDRWTITLAIARPWATPPSRAQELLENLGGVSSERLALKTLTIDSDGTVLSMKNYVRPERVG